jgi:hypothetical protein
MKIKTPPDNQDNTKMPEIDVVLHEEEGISVRSTPTLNIIIIEALEHSVSSISSSTDSPIISRISPDEFVVSLSFGMADLLRVIRIALDSAGHAYSEPFGETAETWNYVFRIQGHHLP